MEYNAVTSKCETASTNTAAISIGIAGGATVIGSVALAGFKMFKKWKREDKERSKEG